MIAPKQPLGKRTRIKIISLMVGSFIVLLLGVLLFQPRAYFWVIQKVASPKNLVTDTHVEVERTFTPVASTDATAQTAPEHDTISIRYQASHITPDTWAYTSTLSSSNPSYGGGTFEARLFGKDVFQRTDTTSNFTTYTFADADYQTTIKTIRASSVFLPELFNYALNTRFVFAKGSESFWMLHYRFQLDIAKIEKDKPSWFDKDSFPFSSDSTIKDQVDNTYVDVWVNPFTAKVEKEEWRIIKKGNDPTSGNIDLYILLTRTLQYPKTLTIDKPKVTS